MTRWFTVEANHLYHGTWTIETLRAEDESDALALADVDFVDDSADGIVLTARPATEDEIPEYTDEDVDDYYDDMDGDHESALASCGWGTDEDYGCYGDDW